MTWRTRRNAAAAAKIKISVVVAVYNPGEYIDELIASLRAQTLPREEFEVLFCDDDSTDGTGERLAALAGEDANVRYLHNTPNSGWPGKPRNMGIDAARGTYVLFVDNDDWLPADALANLWDYAVANDSDVVMAKEIGHGHTIPWRAFAQNVPRAQLGRDPLLRILTPHKLFRRALLDDHGIRFPEGKVRLEDHLFVMRAYFAADVISIYADRPCYHWVHRDKENASLRPVDPVDYYRDVDRILQVVEDNTGPGELRNTLYQQWYQGKMLRRVSGSGFLRADPERRESLVREIRRVTLARFDESMDLVLSPADRTRAVLLRAGRADLLHQLADYEAATTTRVVVDELATDGASLVLTVSVRPVLRDGSPVLFDETGDRAVRWLPQPLADAVAPHARDFTAALSGVAVSIAARDRATGEVAEVAGEQSFDRVDASGHRSLVGHVRVRVDPTTAFQDGRLPATLDLVSRFVFAGWGSERRLPWPDDIAGDVRLTVGDLEVRAYPTTGTRNVSIRTKVKPAPSAEADTGGPSVRSPYRRSPARRARRRAGRWLRRLAARSRRS